MDFKPADVAVVITWYRESVDEVRRAINSARDNGAGEIIVNVEEGADYTPERWTHEPNRLFLRFAEVRLGVCSMRNLGITATRLPLIVPLDADDYLHPGALAKLTKAYRPGVWVYGGWSTEAGPPDDRGRSLSEVMPAHPPKLATHNLCNATMLFSRQAWKRVGGYDADFLLAEDWAFQCALNEAGYEPVRVDEIIYHYTAGGNRASRVRDHWRHITGLLVEKYPDTMRGNHDRTQARRAKVSRQTSPQEI